MNVKRNHSVSATPSPSRRSRAILLQCVLQNQDPFAVPARAESFLALLRETLND